MGIMQTFSRKKWAIVGADITKTVHSFFQSGKLLKEINHTFVTLVPRNINANSLTNFGLYHVATWYAKSSQKCSTTD